MEKLPSIALGTWSWGTGFAGGDRVFGNNLGVEELNRIRRGDGQRAEPLEFRRGVWHGSFGNATFCIYEEL